MATSSLAHSPLYRVLVRVSENCSGMERKLQKYFQNPWKSGGGKCRVKAGPSEGTFWVEFYKRQAKEGVIAKKDHSVVVGSTSMNIFIETNETSGENNILEVSQLSSQTESLPEDFSDEKHSDEGGAASSANSFIQKVFLDVEADLNFKLSKEQREKIINLCPNVRIEGSHDGIETVIGNYQDIEKIYGFLNETMMGGDHKEDFSHLASAREMEPNDYESLSLYSNAKSRSEEVSDLISVPSQLYEYFKYFFGDTLDRIESDHEVHIKSTPLYPTSNVCLDFEGSNPSDRKAAQEAFTRAFQREVQNVTRKDLYFTDNKMALEVQKIVFSMFQSVYVKVEGKALVLWGTPKDISDAQYFIEVNYSRQQSMKITNSQDMMDNEVEVDTIHLRLLRQEIREIEKRYDTIMELVNKPQIRKTFITFKPKHRDVDLTACAQEDIVDMFQMLLPQIIKEVVILKPLNQEKKYWPDKAFFEDFERKNPQVNLEWHEPELTLTGLPKYLGEAMKYIKRHFNIDYPVQQKQGPALSIRGNWNSDPRSSLNKNGADFKMALPPSRGLPSCGDLGKEEEEGEEECVICLEKIHHKEVLPKCKHGFCGPCIREAMKHKPVCPVCQTSYGIMKGNQPEGTMTTSYRSSSLPGFNSCGTIVIHYDMRGGIQTEDHPNPGKRYEGTRRVAYLPNNEEGQQVLHLLRRAFDQKLIFTVGQSQTSGVKDVITWNDIHHKTVQFGGPENYGYPDPNYLQRVKLELKAKGIE